MVNSKFKVHNQDKFAVELQRDTNKMVKNNKKYEKTILKLKKIIRLIINIRKILIV